MPELRLPGGTVSGRALIFDKDGVIVDFHRFWGEVSRQRVDGVTRRAELTPTEAEALTRELGIVEGRVDPTGPLAVGTRLEEESIASAFLYRRGMPWIKARRLVEEAFDAAEGSLDWTIAVQPLGNLVETFRTLAAHGWKLGIATSDLTRNAQRHAELLGIAETLGAIVGADAVSRSKPHPDLVLECCELLKVSPSECLVIGDTLADLFMGQSAGCAAVIGVLSGVSPSETLAPHADAMLEGAWELPALSTPSPLPPPVSVDPEKIYLLFTDGASKGNPGPAGLGAVIQDADGNLLAELAEPLGETTNNVAEYRALIRGLEEAERLGIRRLKVHSDSELVIKQLKGAYAVKHEGLISLYHLVRDLLGSFKDVELTHVERAKNAKADALANEGVSKNHLAGPQGG